jgi:hypothetical protein
MFKTIRIVSVIAFILLLSGTYFKTMHWMGANVMLIAGSAAGILLFILLLASFPAKLSGTIGKFTVIVASLTLILGMLALSFNLMKWPGAAMLIWIADMAVFFSAVLFLADGVLERNQQKSGTKLQAAFFALLLLVIILLSK